MGNDTIRDRTIGVMINGKPACNLNMLGEYLVWLESEQKRRDGVIEKLMGEITRVSQKCAVLETRIGIKTDRAKAMLDNKIRKGSEISSAMEKEDREIRE